MFMGDKFFDPYLLIPLNMEVLLSLVVMLFGQTTVINKQTTYYEDVHQAIVREFGDEADIAESVFRCESGLRPDATSPTKEAVGVAQIFIPAHRNKIDCDLKNFQCNLRLAKRIRDDSGWGAWVCWSSGKYKIYLK